MCLNPVYTEDVKIPIKELEKYGLDFGEPDVKDGVEEPKPQEEGLTKEQLYELATCEDCPEELRTLANLYLNNPEGNQELKKYYETVLTEEKRLDLFGSLYHGYKNKIINKD